MASGKRCGSPALRNQRYCWAHNKTHRIYERERALGRILDRLGDKLDAMDTSELLDFLHHKLERLQKTFNRFPDVRYTLNSALDRIQEITELESMAKQQIQSNQMLLEQIIEYQKKSKTQAQILSHQQFTENQPA